MHIKVILNMDKSCLTIYTPIHPNGEVFNNLPEGPLIPTFQHKINKNSNCSLRLQVNFEGKKQN